MKKVLAYTLGTLVFFVYIVAMIFLFDRACQIEDKMKQPDPIQVIRIQEALEV